MRYAPEVIDAVAMRDEWLAVCLTDQRVRMYS
jgi:hypothetical protein